jgi:hypothetical protein
VRVRGLAREGREAFRAVVRGNTVAVYEPSGREPPANPVLRYLAILSAARDFGVDECEIERIAGRVDPLDVTPEALAEELADALLRPRKTA